MTRLCLLLVLVVTVLSPAVPHARESACICYRAFECRRVCHKKLARREVEACIEPRCAEHMPLATYCPEVEICPRCDDHKPLTPCFPEPCEGHCD